MVRYAGDVFLCISAIRPSDLDCTVQLAPSVHCHCRRSQRGTGSSQPGTSCQLTDRRCPADMGMVQMSPPHSRNLDTAACHVPQIKRSWPLLIRANFTLLYRCFIRVTPRADVALGLPGQRLKSARDADVRLGAATRAGVAGRAFPTCETVP